MIPPLPRDLYKRLRHSKFVRNTAETLATRLLVVAVGLVSSIVVARTLGPSGRGLFAVAGAVAALGIQFGNLGLHASNTYYVAKDRSALSPLLANTLVVSLLGGGGVAAVAWAAAELWPGLPPVRGPLLLLSLASIPAGLAYMLLQNLLLGLQRVRSYNLLDVSSKLAGLALIVLVVALGAGSVETLFAVSLVVSLGCLGFALWIVWPEIPDLPRPSFPLFQKTIRYGLKSYLTSLFTFLVLRVDLLMVKYMLGEQETGYYSIAVAMADMVYMLALVVNTLLFPRFAAIEDPKVKWRLMKETLAALTVLMVGLCVPAAALSGILIETLFGVPFLPAATPFLWLLPAVCLLGVASILMSYVASIDIPSSAAPYACGVMLLNVALNLELIPAYGTTGAAISSVVCYGLLIPFNAFHARRLSKAGPA
jgi:O-antigen/teichoic acid export membrane protein